MQMDVHKTLYPFYTTQKMPHVMATVAKMGFVGSHSHVYYDNFLHRLSTDLFSKQGTFFTKVLPLRLTKPQITILFYLARLVSVI